MAQQESTIVVPVVLFEQRGVSTVDRGNCACAIVGQGGLQLRYKLVCYNADRQTYCTATITGSNEHSLQFSLQTSEYASFRDDNSSVFNMMFLRSSDIEPFLAQLGLAMFGAAGQPSHSPLLADLSHSTKRAAPQLQIAQRAKTRFHSYGFDAGVQGGLPKLGGLMETNGDTQYVFEALQSSYALLPDGKGFEASVAGMAEDTKRIVVVPAGMPRGSAAARSSPSGNIVFIVHLVRAVPLDPSVPAGPAPSFMSSSALVLVSPPSAAAVVDVKPPVAEPAPTYSSSTNGSSGGSGLGGGVPAEHMLLVQKVAAQINTSASTLRDLQDKIASFSTDWQQTQNRPKPSVLSGQALEQGVKQLVADHDKLKDEVVRREDLIKALEERNVDLQRRVDKAAQTAQSLMDEKKHTVSQSSDTRLENDRQVMKLQEQVGRASNERDDLTRHLQTVKKLLDMSDTDLRETKGKAEVLQVQSKAIADKLDAAEGQLGEERSRRKAHEAKVAALLEEIRAVQAELQLKTALLEDLRRQAESDRVHYGQLMEDERQRRGLETAQLRSEILTELQTREQKFLADRARVAEEHHARGRDEGLDLGRREARIDMEAKVTELLLEAQRARSELDAYKTQVRSLQDDSMSEHRRLDAIISALKRNTEEATREKAGREYQLQAAQLKTRNAEDQILLAVTSAVHRTTRPVSSADLLQMLEDIRQGKYPDFSFEVVRRNEEREAIISRRLQWIADELEQQYARVLVDTHFVEFHSPIHAQFQALTHDIKRLWEERDRKLFGAVFDQEARDRFDIATEQHAAWSAFCGFVTMQAHDRAQVDADEQRERVVAEAEGLSWFLVLEQIVGDHREERAVIEGEEENARQPTVDDEHRCWDAAFREFQAVLFARDIAQQGEVIEEESHARAVVEECEEIGAWQALLDVENSERSEAVALTEARLEAEREEAERQRALLQRCAEEQTGVIEEETSAREAIVRECDGEQSLRSTQEATERPQPPPPPAASVAAAPMPPATRSAATTDSPAAVPVARPRAAASKAPAADPLGLGGGVHVTEAADSDSDEDFASRGRAPPPKAAAKAPAAKPATKLFEDSDESDKEAARPPAKPAAKKAPAPPRAKIFDSDDD